MVCLLLALPLHKLRYKQALPHLLLPPPSLLPLRPTILALAVPLPKMRRILQRALRLSKALRMECQL